MYRHSACLAGACFSVAYNKFHLKRTHPGHVKNVSYKTTYSQRTFSKKKMKFKLNANYLMYNIKTLFYYFSFLCT